MDVGVPRKIRFIETRQAAAVSAILIRCRSPPCRQITSAENGHPVSPKLASSRRRCRASWRILTRYGGEWRFVARLGAYCVSGILAILSGSAMFLAWAARVCLSMIHSTWRDSRSSGPLKVAPSARRCRRQPPRRLSTWFRFGSFPRTVVSAISRVCIGRRRRENMLALSRGWSAIMRSCSISIPRFGRSRRSRFGFIGGTQRRVGRVRMLRTISRGLSVAWGS
jgi:hypothetical protein